MVSKKLFFCKKFDIFSLSLEFQTTVLMSETPDIDLQAFCLHVLIHAMTIMTKVGILMGEGGILQVRSLSCVQ